MKVNNIHEGLVTKGYKGMCLLLDEKIKDGKSKKYQVKDWKRYFDWIEHTSRKWEVTKVHDVVQSKQDGRVNNQGGNNVKYSEEVDTLISFLLYVNYTMDETLSGWQSHLNLCYGNLYDFAEKANDIAEEVGYPVWYAWDFFATVRGLFNSQIKRSFGRLEKKGLVTIHKRTIICDTDGKYEEATEKQIEDVKEIKNKLLDEMNFRNVQVCIMFGKYFEYIDKLDERLLDIDIESMFDRYELVRPMGQEFDDSFHCQDFNHYDSISHRLNEKICNSIIENAIKRKENAIQRQTDHDEWGLGTPSEYEKLPYSVKQRASDTYDYVEFYKKMVDKYIRFPVEESDQELNT